MRSQIGKNVTGSKLKDQATVAAVRLADGSFGWRVRDGSGEPVKTRFGRIYGIDGNATETDAYKASLRAIERVLRTGGGKMAIRRKGKPLATPVRKLRMKTRRDRTEEPID